MIADGAVAVAADRIVAVAPAAAVRGRFAPHRRIDARDRIVMPGLVWRESGWTPALARRNA